ncbi:hypothetical protein Pint_01467 [Pistacia integerrima]|uniref:Uncharacterized protein n=1 Tax=Pistacia integerrima TaxID=434235 RepID=A0ACC0ZHU6_9ROSI|nr:hypothetical protein Pint_01467 [Pistacia integerrima]
MEASSSCKGEGRCVVAKIQEVLSSSSNAIQRGRCCHRRAREKGGASSLKSSEGGIAVVEQGRREVRYRRNPAREVLPSSSKGLRESGVGRLN